MRIEEPDWKSFWNAGLVRFTAEARQWFFHNVEPLNKMFEEGVEVTGEYCDLSERNYWNTIKKMDDTHKAILLNIQPIKAETAEDVLRSLLRQYDNGQTDSFYRSLKRIRAVLDEA